MRVKMSKQPPPAPTASAEGPCPTVIQIVGRPGTGSLPRTIAPPDHPVLADRGRKKRERIDVRKMSKQHTPASTESALRPCPTIIQTSRTPRH